MAKLPNGILGPASGSIGPVICYNYRGKECMRSRPKKSKRKATPAQLKQQKKFKLLHAFLSPLSQTTDLYFGHKSGTRSRTNMALSHHLLHAISENDNNVAIDYAQVVIAKGYLPSATITEMVISDEQLRIQWVPNGGRDLANDSDKVVIVVLSQAEKSFFFPAKESTRSAGEFTTPLPEDWKSKDNVVWFFFAKQDDSDCSTSVNFYKR